jgi:hypothetical protein
MAQSLSAEQIASYYTERVPELKQNGAGEWRGACPIHQGVRDSFAVNSKSGRWYCHSQCDRGGSIFGLEMAIAGVNFRTARTNVLRILAEAMIGDQNSKLDTSESAVASGMVSAVSKRDLAVLDQRIQKFAKKNALRFINKYRYRYADGPLCYFKAKFKDADGEKTFLKYALADGRWTTPKKAGIVPILYNLDLLAEADEIYLCNGEKAANAGRKELGLVTTCLPDGEAHWDGQFTPVFEGKRVIVLLDNDAKGLKHGQVVARELFGHAAEIRLVKLPGLPPKGDLFDWIKAGGTAKKLRKIIEATPVVTAPVSAEVAQALARIETLQPDISLPVLEAALRAIADDVAGVDQLQSEIVREASLRKLKELGCSAPARLIDAAFHGATPELASSSVSLSDVEPWPEPVDGVALLSELTDVVLRFIVLPRHLAETVALWIYHAHAYEAFDVSPYLLITSPEKRCGKTRLVSLITALVPRALAASNITAAAIFRTIEACHPVLLIDEADTFINENEEMRGIINSGHSRDAAFVIRLVGDKHEPKRFSTWCPKVVALIGKPPQTIEDRSIRIQIQRKTRSEEVEKWRTTAGNTLEPIKRKVARWAADNLAALKAATPDVPELGNDRAEDNWGPLLAVADHVGGDWPQTVRKAAVQLNRGLEDDESPRVLLLADLRDLFEKKQVDRLPSERIIESLARMEHRPWPEWKQGKPITAVQLANELKHFSIRPRTIRLADGTTPKGYKLESFQDPFKRYLPKRDATDATNMKTKGLSNR